MEFIEAIKSFQFDRIQFFFSFAFVLGATLLHLSHDSFRRHSNQSFCYSNNNRVQFSDL